MFKKAHFAFIDCVYDRSSIQSHQLDSMTRQWVASDLPLGELVSIDANPGKAVSAGTQKHSLTPKCCRDDVVSWIESCVENGG